jgi:DNA-binding LacI/PurR family transcriptional regulator
MASRTRKLTFVLIIPRFEDIFHSYYAGEIIRGVSLASSRLNADLLIHMTDRSDHSTWLSPAFMNRGYVDGILFADIDNDINIVKKAIRSGMCCMVLNNILSEPINYIAMDNKKAAVEIVNHLVALGHKNIATIAGDVSTQAGLMRLEGFREALDDKGIKVSRTNITFGDFLRTPARLAAQKLLKQKERPTAIFAASDVMALELIDVAKSMGMKVPEELSVVGFDDNPLVISRSVNLTTVSQPLVEMGRLGLENLYQISRGKARLPVKIVLPTELIKRGSTVAHK